MTTILLTRHGHVEWLEPERFRGRAELPLSEEGRRQAAAIRDRIRASWAPTALYTSPMGRAVVTGQIIADAFGLTGHALAGLNDIDYGKWQGKTPDEVRASSPVELAAWYRTPDLMRFPGGEALQDVLARAADTLRALLRHHPAGTVVLVGHDSVNRVILLDILGLPLSHYWRLKQDTCALSHVEFADGVFTIATLNETWHLHGT